MPCFVAKFNNTTPISDFEFHEASCKHAFLGRIRKISTKINQINDFSMF